MPQFLEKKLKKEYGGNKHAIYGTMNKLGFMKGNKETAKGKHAQSDHVAKTKALHKAMKKAGRQDYEMEEETKHHK